MALSIGIVGLPNVGKSTTFNALTKAQNAEAANYPFCTIEPNVGQVPVPDERIYKLSKLAGSKEVIPTQLSFVDIAGLVRGASKGEGRGNRRGPGRRGRRRPPQPEEKPSTGAGFGAGL